MTVEGGRIDGSDRMLAATFAATSAIDGDPAPVDRPGHPCPRALRARSWRAHGFPPSHIAS
jgi:hypothetical protein